MMFQNKGFILQSSFVVLNDLYRKTLAGSFKGYRYFVFKLSLDLFSRYNYVPTYLYLVTLNIDSRR